MCVLEFHYPTDVAVPKWYNTALDSLNMSNCIFKCILKGKRHTHLHTYFERAHTHLGCSPPTET